MKFRKKVQKFEFNDFSKIKIFKENKKIQKFYEI